MKIDIIKVAKEVFKDKELILEDVGKDKVKINYKGKTSKPKPIVLPRKIEMNEKLGEFCGLYYAEGFNSKNSCWHITQFTNSEPELIRQFISFLESDFSFEKNDLTFKIKVSEGKYFNLSKEETINFWKKELDLNGSSRIQFYRESRITKKYSHCMMVYFGNTVFRSILNRIIEKICEISISNHKVRCGFLRGLFAGEGCVILNKSSLFGLEISQGFKKDNEKDRKIGRPKREFIKKLLELEQIQTNNPTSGIKVIITNFKNLERFHSLMLHSLHPKKFDKCNGGFNHLKKNKRAGITNNEAEYEMLNLILSKGPLSIRSISRLRRTKVMTNVEVIKGRKDRNKIGLLNKGFLYSHGIEKISKKPSELFGISDTGKTYLSKIEEKIKAVTIS